MALLVVFVAIALLVSFLCSVMEAVLLSTTPGYIGAKEQEDPQTGKRLRELRENIDKPLAAILSLNTIAHTVGAAGAGAQAAVVFGDAALGVFSAVLTLAILVLSEIIPKTLGAVYWKGLAPWNARLLGVLMVLLWPLVKMSEGLTYLLARGKKGASISRAEIAALAQEGERAGVVVGQESRILKNLFGLRALGVRDIMTPATVVFALHAQETVAETVAAHPKLRFSRVPLHDEKRDHIVGVVLKDEILQAAAADRHGQALGELRREALFVDESLALPELFERFLEEHQQFAVAVDEFGGLAGVVTMEDLVETLLGAEIVDEADDVRDMQELARRQWRKRAEKLGLVEDLEG